MSHTRIQRLRSVQAEFEAAQASLQLSIDEWATLHTRSVLSGQTIRNMRLTQDRLENTYLVRLFAEFEAILREYCDETGAAAPNNVKALMDRVGARRGINTVIRTEAHNVRERRNVIVHRGGTAYTIDFLDALANLNRFLAWLPEPT